jgi:hypothetical protein
LGVPLLLTEEFEVVIMIAVRDRRESETLGFSSLICFVVGYVWLIFRVTS